MAAGLRAFGSWLRMLLGSRLEGYCSSLMPYAGRTPINKVVSGSQMYECYVLDSVSMERLTTSGLQRMRP